MEEDTVTIKSSPAVPPNGHTRETDQFFSRPSDDDVCAARACVCARTSSSPRPRRRRRWRTLVRARAHGRPFGKRSFSVYDARARARVLSSTCVYLRCLDGKNRFFFHWLHDPRSRLFGRDRYTYGNNVDVCFSHPITTA